jgi:hypothetical protein
MRLAPTLAAIALLTATACAPVAPPPGPLAGGPARQCFFASTVNGFREAAGGQVVNFSVGANQVYQVELFGRCSDLGRAEKVLLDSRAGGSSVCSGLDVELIVPTPTGPRRCPGRSLRRLTETEIAALPSREKP